MRLQCPTSAVLLSVLLLMAAPAGAADPIEVGRRKQLFVDDRVVADAAHVTRELGAVTKANDGKPIFTEGWFYGTVLYDDGRFKLWYRKPAQAGYGYAESADGLRFEKTADVSGINFAGDYTLSVTIDEHATDPDHRYKAGYDAPGMAAGIAHSSDGIRWTPYNGGKPVTGRAADTYNQILWDEDARLYRLFTRTDFGPAGGAEEWRGTRSMTNPDVMADPTAWKTVRSWAFQREGEQERHRRQIYALTDWIYHGAHFALMSVYEWPGDVSAGGADLVKRHERDVMNFYIGTSRNADNWDLTWVYAGKPMIPRGPDGAFDKDIVLPASQIVTHDDRHWLYYAGANERHGTGEVTFPRKHAIGLATLRLDGFVALVAGDEAGTVTTKPFRLDGSAVEVNVDATNGTFAMEVLDAAGKPLPGYTAGDAMQYENVDNLRLRPCWRNADDLSPLKGRMVRLRFHLRHARLYAFQIVIEPASRLR
ncbi:MAG: hypothetical protein KY476_19065 [Planctomycetes bacterium]|nr:hypothetical protein [Planctomycetota bacterium]